MKPARLDKIKSHLKKQGLDALLISSVHHITYLTGYANFSPTEREAYLLITKDGHYIFTDGRYTEAVKNQITQFNLIEIAAKSPLKKTLKQLAKKHQINILGIEESNLTVSEQKRLLEIFKDLKDAKLHNSRTIKDNEEVDKIREACKIGDQTFEFILSKIKPGVSEKQLVWEMEQFIKKRGGQFSFEPIIAFGKNSSVPHHQTGNSILENSAQFVLMDFGVKIDSYCSDMTRTVFLGKASLKQKELYQTVYQAQQNAEKYIRTNINKKVQASMVDRIARKYINQAGYLDIPHALGHGIGLEVHEHPFLSVKSHDLLKTGMVFSLEPGIYIPDFGGVRIEDLYLTHKSGLIRLTQSPTELVEL